MTEELLDVFKCPLCKRLAYYVLNGDGKKRTRHVVAGYVRKEDERKFKVTGICPCHRCSDGFQIELRREDHAA